MAARNNELFAGTFGAGVFYSNNNGKSWEARYAGIEGTKVMALAVSGNYMFAGTYGKGMFRSSNNGISWKPIMSGTVFSFLIDGTDLYAGGYEGVYLSTNYGDNWVAVNSGMERRTIYALAVSDSILFAGTDSGIFRSINKGITWTVMNTGLPLPSFDVRSIVICDTSIFAGGYFHGVFVSRDMAKHWTVIIYNLSIRDLNIMALAVKDSFLFAGTEQGRVFRRYVSGITEPTSVKHEKEQPTEFKLSQNYPNPFNPTSKIEYSIPQTAFVTLKVYDILGKEIATLVNEEKLAGNYEVNFNGNRLSSGIYFYKIQAGGYSSMKKMVLLK